MDADGSHLERVPTGGTGAPQSPSWSPSGERIVFQGAGGLWTFQLSTGRRELILEDASPELTPDWSPDGRFIAFTSERSGSTDLWVVSYSDRTPSRLSTNAHRDVWPRWAPDGRSIVFFSRRDTEGERDELYVMDWQSREVERLTVHPAHHDFVPDWSPDGARIVAALSDGVTDRALVIHDRGGREPWRFAEGYHRVFQPTWSPDGRYIAFAARAHEGEAADIYVIPTSRLSPRAAERDRIVTNIRSLRAVPTRRSSLGYTRGSSHGPR